MPRVGAVEVAVGLRDDSFRRHRKNRDRARKAWKGLVKCGPALQRNPFYGTQIQKHLFPHAFGEYENLWKLDLPGAFRAVYSILARPGGGVRVAIEWIGDHDEYDRLFGY